jgi:hypothetical protein
MKNLTSTMPLSRQARYFNPCREKWRKRALENQQKVRFLLHAQPLHPAHPSSSAEPGRWDYLRCQG